MVNDCAADYRPFDASNWLLTDAGLIGPVTLAPILEATTTGSRAVHGEPGGLKVDCWRWW